MNFFLEGFAFGKGQETKRPKAVSGSGFIGDRTVFEGGIEWDDRRCRDAFFPKGSAKGFRGRVVVFRRGEDLGAGAPNFLFGYPVERDRLDDRHRAIRQGAGLVEANRVDAGQHLDAIKLLNEHFLFGEGDDPYGKACGR